MNVSPQRLSTARPARIRPAVVLSLMAAAVLGIALAAWLTPKWQAARRLNDTTSDDPAVRTAAWDWLSVNVESAEGREPRAAAILDDISERLIEADDDALLEAGTALRTIQLWGWSHQPTGLVLRDALLRAASSELEQQRVAGAQMMDVPLGAPPNHVLAVFEHLAGSDDGIVRRDAFDAAWMWSGTARAEHVAALFSSINDEALRQRNVLVAEWAGNLRDGARAVESDSTTAASISDRWSAWCADDIDDDALHALLAFDDADVPPHVYQQVLLAERHLPDEQSAQQAEQWIRSFDDAHKRAGALLTALLPHADHELLREAAGIEDRSDVRAMQILALWASDVPVPVAVNIDQPPIELAWRMLHEPDGDFDPDIALVLLLAGDPRILEYLTSQPEAVIASRIARRLWLIERFIPAWREHVGEPAELTTEAIRHHLAALEAVRLLTQRRLAFDRDAREFVLRASP